MAANPVIVESPDVDSAEMPVFASIWAKVKLEPSVAGYLAQAIAPVSPTKPPSNPSGGGVGIYDGCSAQWGTSDLGARYGGFLTACSGDVNCLKNKCKEVFTGKQELLDGCMFHAEWMGGANNPQFHYKEVDCPAALEQRSKTG